MTRQLERLLTWIADALDRSLFMMPELDDEWPAPSDRLRPST
jgi:hypothetical protein